MPDADIILKNVRVITMDRRQPAASLVAVKGDRIIYVGDDEAEAALTSAGTRVIDCEGKTVLPGFNDAHVHLFSFLRKLVSLDLSPEKVSSIADIRASVKREAENSPPGRWISGTDFSDFYLAEKRYPTRRDLDEASPRNPVVLSHAGLHVCVLNSPALRLAGINRETEAPEGCFIERDGHGEPTGVLYEMLGYIREKVMPPFTDSEIEKGMTLANRHFVSQGITSLQDATVVNDLRRFRILKRMKDKGRLIPRIYMMFGGDKLKELQEAGLSFLSGDEELRLGGVKILITESTGRVYPEQDALNERVVEIAQAGFPVAIHAAQSQCVDAAVSALEHLNRRLPGLKLRQRIEHLSICLPGSLEKLKRIKPVIAVQPAFVFYSGDRYLARAAAEERDCIFRFRSFIESGLTLAASSDSPIAPDSPVFAIYSAMTRKTRGGNTLLPGESLSAGDVLRMYTANAACASCEEGIKGTVTPGTLADLVVLDGNPLKATAGEIRDTRVTKTILSGRVVFEG